VYGRGGTVFYNYGLWTRRMTNPEQLLGGTAPCSTTSARFRKFGRDKIPVTRYYGNPVTFNNTAACIDVQSVSKRFDLVLQGTGNFTGGYTTTKTRRFDMAFQRRFYNPTRHGHVHQRDDNPGALVGTNVSTALFDLGSLGTGTARSSR